MRPNQEFINLLRNPGWTYSSPISINPVVWVTGDFLYNQLSGSNFTKLGNIATDNGAYACTSSSSTTLDPYTRTTSVINGYSTITDQTGKNKAYMRAANASMEDNDGVSLFVVYRRRNDWYVLGAPTTCVLADWGGRNIAVGLISSTYRVYGAYSSGGSQSVPYTTSANTWYYCSLRTGTTTNDSTFRIDGSTQSNTIGGGYDDGPGGVYFNLLNRTSGDDVDTGIDIAEVMVFNWKLSNSNTDTVELYLKNKYGL